MERNDVERPMRDGEREESDRLDFVDDERGSLPGGKAGDDPFVSSDLRVEGSTRERGLKCRSMS